MRLVLGGSSTSPDPLDFPSLRFPPVPNGPVLFSCLFLSVRRVRSELSTSPAPSDLPPVSFVPFSLIQSLNALTIDMNPKEPEKNPTTVNIEIILQYETGCNVTQKQLITHASATPLTPPTIIRNSRHNHRREQNEVINDITITMQHPHQWLHTISSPSCKVLEWPSINLEHLKQPLIFVSARILQQEHTRTEAGV